MNPYQTKYDSILFPIDDPELAERAAPFVAQIAKRLDADVQVQVNRRSAAVDDHPDTARARAAKVTEVLGDQGVRFGSVQSNDARDTDAIRDLAAEGRNDLILVVSDGKPGVFDRLFGDRLSELVSDSPCDLLCVQAEHLDGQTEIERVLVPVNYQEEAVASLGRALSWAQSGTQLHLYYDTPPTFPFLHTARGVNGDHQVDSDKVDEVWHQELTSFWAQHGDPAIDVTMSRGDGGWTDGTKKAADRTGSDLIVAAESNGTFSGLAEKLALEATACPVLLVRVQAEDSTLEPPDSALGSARSVRWSEDVLDFWFGDLDDDGLAAEWVSARWWKKDSAFDREIRERFGRLLEAAGRGELEIGSEPRERLAALIVLDQFSRNVGRGTPAMYANDDRAREIAARLVEAGIDKTLPTAMRSFCYLPFMHNERLDDQNYCVALFEVMKAEAPSAARGTVDEQLDFARRHRDIVERFGRFPHRNEILRRTNTPEEVSFLGEDGSSF